MQPSAVTRSAVTGTPSRRSAARCPASWQATPSKNGQNNPPGSRHSQQQPRTMAAGVTLRRRRGDLIVKDGEGLRDRAAAAQGLVKAADGDL